MRSQNDGGVAAAEGKPGHAAGRDAVYGVIGFGAVGGFYGALLAAAGRAVYAVIRHGGDEVVRDGFRLLSPDRPLHLDATAGAPAPVVPEGRDGVLGVVASVADLPLCDVLVIGVKAGANDAVLADLRAHVTDVLRPGGTVLLVQNGIGADPDYQRAVAPVGGRVVGGLAFLCSVRRSVGVVDHIDYGRIVLAPFVPGPDGGYPAQQAAADGATVAAVDGIAADLRAAGLDVLVRDDLLRARWEKLVWNMPFSGLGVAFGALSDRLVADPRTAALARTIMAEIEAAAAADGRALSPGLAERQFANTIRMRPYASSMAVDYAAGRPLELEAIYRAPLARAAAAGADMPTTSALADTLALLDRRRQTGAPAEPVGDLPDLAVAQLLADVADRISTAGFGRADLAVTTKPDRTPVTEIDTAVERAVRAVLGVVRADDAILGEEYGGDAAGLRRGRAWVVDPIDGTKAFLRGTPVWATLIGLLVDGTPTVGVVSAPALGRRWHARTGGGAWVTDPLHPTPRRIHVSAVTDLADASLSYTTLDGWAEFGRRDAFVRLLDTVWNTRALGDFLSHMLVAEGVVDLAVEPELALHDMAGLVPIVVEAGGRFTSVDGVDGMFGGNALTSNGHLHAAAVTALRATHRAP